MMFQIKWEENAINELHKLDAFIIKRILKRIKILGEKDFLLNVKRLKGSRFFSLRAGDYRIIFDLDQQNRRIRILKVGHRKNIYKT